jgi:hypothetical protein
MRTCAIFVDTQNSDEAQVSVIAEGFFGTQRMVLPMGVAAFDAAMEAWDAGALVQTAFPKLNPTQREFLMTGMPPLTQRKVFNEHDPDEN